MTTRPHVRHDVVGPGRAGRDRVGMERAAHVDGAGNMYMHKATHTGSPPLSLNHVSTNKQKGHRQKWKHRPKRVDGGSRDEERRAKESSIWETEFISIHKGEGVFGSWFEKEQPTALFGFCAT